MLLRLSTLSLIRRNVVKTQQSVLIHIGSGTFEIASADYNTLTYIENGTKHQMNIGTDYEIGSVAIPLEPDWYDGYQQAIFYTVDDDSSSVVKTLLPLSKSNLNGEFDGDLVTYKNHSSIVQAVYKGKRYACDMCDNVLIPWDIWESSILDAYEIYEEDWLPYYPDSGDKEYDVLEVKLHAFIIKWAGNRQLKIPVAKGVEVKPSSNTVFIYIDETTKVFSKDVNDNLFFSLLKGEGGVLLMRGSVTHNGSQYYILEMGGPNNYIIVTPNDVEKIRELNSGF